MWVDRKEDLDAERAMRQGLRSPWGANVPKVAIPEHPDVTFRLDGPFMVGLTRDPHDWRIVRGDAVDVRTSWDPRQQLRRRLALLCERGEHGEVV